MALQELDYTIAYVRGSENTVADAMSRLCANFSDLVIKVHPATTGTEPENLPGPFCGALKIIPEMTDTQRDALNMCHNKFVGHGGVKCTEEKLLGLPIEWEHMVQHTHLFIQQCACCQKMNATREPDRKSVV